MDPTLLPKSEEYLYFFRQTHTYGCFSQWYACNFIEEGIEFCNAEQYMMYSKAMLFGDENIAKKILSSKSPSEMKSLGRKIKNFDQITWDNHKHNIVVKGNYYKFSQNAGLAKELLGTGTKIIAEASRYDKIWGIGIVERKGLTKSDWRGENLLGLALMEVREKIKSE